MGGRLRPALTFRWWRTAGPGDREQVNGGGNRGAGAWPSCEAGEKGESVGSAFASAVAFHPRLAPQPPRHSAYIGVGSGGGRARFARRRTTPAGAQAPGRPPFPPPPLFPPANSRRRRVWTRPPGGRCVCGARAPSPPPPAAATTQVALLAARPAVTAPLRTYRSSPSWIRFASPCGGGWGRGWGGTPRTGGALERLPPPLGDIIVMALGAVGGRLPRVHPYCSTQCQSR